MQREVPLTTNTINLILNQDFLSTKAHKKTRVVYPDAKVFQLHTVAHYYYYSSRKRRRLAVPQPLKKYSHILQFNCIIRHLIITPRIFLLHRSRQQTKRLSSVKQIFLYHFPFNLCKPLSEITHMYKMGTQKQTNIQLSSIT